jgi:hypothetical protein
VKHLPVGTALIVAGLALSGCTSAPPAHPTAKLSGKVTIDKVPVATGNLQFVPQAGNAGKSAAGAIKDGVYDAPDVPIGNVKVMISATRETGEVDTSHDPPIKNVVNIVPAKYQSGIGEIDVTGDNPNQDFELTSQ